MSRNLSRRRWAVVVALTVTAAALSAQQPPRLPDPEPPTRGAAPPAALRPLVAGPNGGVSTGHPLVTSAALEILHKGGNAFDAGVAALLVGGVVEQDLYSLGGEALVLVYPVSGEEGHLDRRPGLGAQGRRRRLVHVARQDAAGRRARSGGGSGGAARRADRAREVGHDVVREGLGAGHRVRARRLPAAPAHRRRRRRQSRVLQEVARQPALLAEARRLDAQGRRDDQAADAGPHADADGRGRARPPRAAAAPPASSPPATGSTRATSPGRWWRS